MLTTPEQRAQWAKTAEHYIKFSGVVMFRKLAAAVPSLLADVEELEKRLALATWAKGIVHSVAVESMPWAQEGPLWKAQVERLTALLREANIPHEKPMGGTCHPDCLRCRIEEELHD